ncbi:MAG: excinuclease ABC subunit UvrA [Desulfobacterales bacterium]|nr:excinuclease ABC subunit UvrA [Desulfobacterales bacterium]
MNSDRIIIKGAREHNLKNIDIEIPRNSLVTLTGLSGSGKSTLAFDTLYAEGQRRYVESLSTYARQFLGQMDKPDVDSITGLSPAISIEQKTASHNPRSTVGTVTEIYDYMRLLYARVGTPHCYKCNSPISSMSIDQIIDRILKFNEKTKIIILSPIVSNKKGTYEKTLLNIKKQGFARVRINKEIYLTEDVPKLEKNKKHSIDIVVDRLVIKIGIEKRLTDSIELALSLSNGVIKVLKLSEKEEILFSENASCVKCDISYPEFTPASFSFNSPQGACPKCDGLGSVTEFDPDLIVPNKMLSLRDGAIIPWATRNSVQFIEFLDALTSFYNEDIYTSFNNLDQKFQNVLLYGSKSIKIPFYVERDGKRKTYNKKFEGVIPNLQRRYLETGSNWAREDIKKYLNFKQCSSCDGARLNKASNSVKIENSTISQLTSFSVEKTKQFISSVQLTEKNKIIAKGIIKEIIERIEFLQNVGLEYLTLNRSAATLSGGESQRIRLATQIGSKLTGVLYVLDEPSIGLHQRDNQRLLQTLMNLKNLGNTVLVVEHDEETIMSSDYVIDMGPGAGINGGSVVFQGAPEQLIKASGSLTADYLSGKKKIEVPVKRRKGNGKQLKILKASSNNLASIDASFPLGTFTCVTGVSGSGKSTLVFSTLYRILAAHLHNAKTPPGVYEGIDGLQYLDKVIHINQSPIGRTPRSNPATYTQVFTYIRELFSVINEAKAKGYKPGRFSFNVKGGRCEACRGDGILKIEMHFLPDVYVSCDVCNGKRYNRETLDVKYKGKSIADILDMTINQASRFFSKIPTINTKLKTLINVGIGYIKLGQSATTLSGGEAQRIKLAKELSKRSTGRTIFILDEPTTGLHTDDIKKLLNVLNRLVLSGNTVIVIEHNLDVIKYADYIIDLGPEGGDKGGKIIAVGTPEQIAATPKSYTGNYLKDVLKKQGGK